MVITVLMAASSATAAVLPQALVSSSSKGRSSSQGYGELCRLASRRQVCVRESFRPWKPLTTCALPSSVSSRDSIRSAKKGSPTITPAVLTPSGPADLQTLLLRNRIVFVGSPVNSQVAQRVISQLLTLAAIDENEDIKMYINCPGGSTYSILAIYDTMAWIKPAVSTVCFGIAASQGALLLAGGEKGKRFAMPNARIMIHQPQGGCGGTVDDVRRQVNEVMTSRDKLDKMYSVFTGQPLERVQKFTDRDRFFSAAELVTAIQDGDSFILCNGVWIN